MPAATKKIYQLKINLKGAKPPIWRRFLVNSTVKLDQFHRTLQVVMGWYGGHLHQFNVNGCSYGAPNPDWGFDDVIDEGSTTLGQVLKYEKSKMIYEYDFGDGWEHIITLEKILPFSTTTPLPICIKAKGACPPEDIGGLWAYYDFLEIMKDKNHPEYEDYADWIGGDFDPDHCDLNLINELLLAGHDQKGYRQDFLL
ncbi:plasmid pRiA4b ORF-3 family protein [Thiomicrospira microaerophila]|uniref:plasmid pRiA4b ORF-3 family protein n=1 Tax=Thiomicrospira microaerophila TaxID=406020 RepID=UPI0005C9A7AE|nr:plasmid pRiA4b ORF-3 family protein [Thiomicrospira microaerophila]